MGIFRRFTSNLVCIKKTSMLVCVLLSPAAAAEMALEETLVIGDALSKDTRVVSATSVVTSQELEDINFASVEDALISQPSVSVRRRFIGDPNGVIGIRGSNMFQGTHSMVFTDGMPLHYHLQTRFAGAPRWSLVSPSEVSSVEVIYGPFSAEYSGNAIGGVVNIKTRNPTGRRLTLEGLLFNQDYEQWSTDENYQGGRAYIAYEDGNDSFNFHISYHHLENDSQPQTQYVSAFENTGSANTGSGGFLGEDEENNQVIYYGDSGAENAVSDLVKLKTAYDFGRVQVRATVAYEERQRDEQGHNNFIVDTQGNKVWNGSVNQDGRIFSVSGSNFQHRLQERNSLLLGTGLSGNLSDAWRFDAFYSQFQILDDEEIRSARNPQDPDFAAQNAAFRARFTEFEDTGWDIFDIKFGTDSLFGNSKQRITLGAHYDAYELNIVNDDYNAILGLRDDDELDGNRATGRADSGGQASTEALFMQYGYALSERWDLALGLRYENWETKEGFSGGRNLAPRSESGFSPKLSLGFFPSDGLSFRYSLARALRFPIIEELYRNDGATSSGSVFIADPSLKPEDGIFHNFSIEQQISGGSLRVNLFYDTLEDVIFNQSTRTASATVTTSLPVDETETKGAEFIYNQKNIANSKASLRFNLSYIDSQISENRLNPEIIGKQFPRLPKWRGSLVLSYDVTNTVGLSTNIRYASNSFGTLDNSDTNENVFGAQDGYLLLGAKASFSLSETASVALGVDNVTNEEIYVFHPWPSRTFYLEGKIRFGE